MRYKLLKPDWGRPLSKGGTPNPEFVKEIIGEDTLEGDFSEELLRVKNEEGYNIYFFPNYPSNLHPEIRYARGEHIDQFDYCFVDMDLKDGVYKTKEEFIQVLKNFQLPPSTVVDSGHGIHAYWKITNLNRDDFVYMQLRLIQQFKTDDSIWTVKQIMRAPGYKNTKNYNNFVDCLILEGFEDKSYVLEELNQVLPIITEDNKKRGTRHLNKMDGLEYAEDLEDIDEDLPEKFIVDKQKNEELKLLFDNPKAYQGDRSSADMKLANLLFNMDYDRSEAYRVLYNTEKSRTRDPGHRQSYAYSTIDKVYTDRPKYYEGSVEDYLKETPELKFGKEVNGPDYMDCQHERWRRGQVLGLVLGTGGGKTTLSMDIIKHILKNNEKGRVIFFSLEMSKDATIRKWLKTSNNDPKLNSRFHVISNEKDGEMRHIGLQEIYWITKDIRKATGDEIIAICIDHMGELSPVVDIKKRPTFNAAADQDGGYSNLRSLGYQNLCSKIKDIAKSLGVFVIMQSQTRREFDRMADLPLDKTAAFGASNFEKMVWWMVTAWQPLARVYNETDLRVTAWQYVKLRDSHIKDKVKLEDPRLLVFDSETESFRIPNEAEAAEFEELKPKADAKRKAAQKNNGEGVQYKISPSSISNLLAKYEERKKQNAKI